MSSGTSEVELLSLLRELVWTNADCLLDSRGDADQPRLEQVSLGEPLHHNQSRYHRVLTIQYFSDGELRTKRVWLKFVPPKPSRYEMHVDMWNHTRGSCDLFPQPYFHGEWTDKSFTGMELVEGASLRAIFLSGMFTRRSAGLTTTFSALGKGMRTFHDSAEPERGRTLDDLRATVRRLVTRTEHLTRGERERVLQRIDSAVQRVGAGSTPLPRIPIHHDCSLRNVVVRTSGSPCLLDVDAIVASRNSRWYDVAVFLVNLESQSKYAPLGSARAIAQAWESFWDGYVDAGPPDGLKHEAMHALLFLTKSDYLLAGTWRPIFEVYTGFLASRYLRRLKKSLLLGDDLTFETERAHDAKG